MSTTTLSAGRIPRGEFVRKAMHMSPGLLPFALAAVPIRPAVLDLLAILVLIAIAVVLTVVFLAWHRVTRRPGETDFHSSTFWYPVTILATLVVFRHHPEFAGVVLVVLAFGDGCAYFGGKLLGRRPLPWNPDKTWAGTISFVVCAAPLGSLAYWFVANHPHKAPVSLGLAFACGTIAAVAGAVAESLPFKITDNLRVGLAAAVAVAIAHFALAGRLM